MRKMRELIKSVYHFPISLMILLLSLALQSVYYTGFLLSDLKWLIKFWESFLIALKVMPLMFSSPI